MRLLIVEKHIALKWVQSGVVIKGFEAPGWNEEKSETEKQEEEEDGEAKSSKPANGELDKTDSQEGKARRSKIPTHWIGLWEMMKSPRALTSFAITFINAIVFGGLLDSAMTIYLSNQYGLNSLGAGLVYLGAVVPTFFVSSRALSRLSFHYRD